MASAHRSLFLMVMPLLIVSSNGARRVSQTRRGGAHATTLRPVDVLGSPSFDARNDDADDGVDLLASLSISARNDEADDDAGDFYDSGVREEGGPDGADGIAASTSRPLAQRRVMPLHERLFAGALPMLPLDVLGHVRSFEDDLTLRMQQLNDSSWMTLLSEGVYFWDLVLDFRISGDADDSLEYSMREGMRVDDEPKWSRLSPHIDPHSRLLRGFYTPLASSSSSPGGLPRNETWMWLRSLRFEEQREPGVGQDNLLAWLTWIDGDTVDAKVWQQEHRFCEYIQQTCGALGPVVLASMSGPAPM